MPEYQLPTSIIVGVAYPDDIYSEEFDLENTGVALVDHAIEFAKRTGASLIFHTSIEGRDHMLPGHETSLHDILQQRLEIRLGALCKKASASGLTSTYEITVGPASLALKEAAERHAAALVMVGPREPKAGILDRFIHGSTARRILRIATVPVWVVYPNTPLVLDHIVVPVDFSPASRQCLKIAKAFAADFGAKLHALHCPDFPNDVALARTTDSMANIRSYHQEVMKAAYAEVEKLLGDDRENWEVHIMEDWVGRALPYFAKHQRMDLIVMASQGRKGLRGFLIGNTAEKILDRLDTSVFVLRPDAMDEESE